MLICLFIVYSDPDTAHKHTTEAATPLPAGDSLYEPV